MGEAERRKQMGLVPRILKPGEQIQVGPEVMKHAVPKMCPCGGKYFIMAVQVSTISALISPIGQELTTQQPVLICLKCQEPLNLKADENQASEN